MTDNKIELKSIGDLSGMNFFIPSYQRGYRWTEQQVKDLLDDIQEFIDNKRNGFYCIQPLVVKVKDATNNQWEVIDGQQRLTTIYILLSYLEKPIYLIEYETRKNDEDKAKDSKVFLQNIKSKTEKDSSENIDFHFMFVAYKTIKEWFEKGQNEKGQNEKGKFKETLLKNVDFIWYESADEDPIKVFTRLNIGKISLTNAELIKAMFLNKSNFQAGSDNQKIRLQQQEIAVEWDKIEYTLQNDEFWLFLNKPEYDKPTRIDFILDLLKDKGVLELKEREDFKNDEEKFKAALGTDDYQTFRYFYIWFKENSDKMLECWKEVKTLFQTFQEWFNDLELYHYVGYLLASVNGHDISKIKINNLVSEWIISGKSKDDFKVFLKDKIIETISSCKDLNKQYEKGSPKTQCRPILLLHNIQAIINQNIELTKGKYKLPVFYKFPFHLFKKESWDVEHIDSHTENQLEKELDQAEWLIFSEYFVDEKLKSEIEAWKMEYKKKKDDRDVEKFDFAALRTKIGESFTNPNKLKDGEKDNLWNFCLLDQSTNRGYGNAIFPAKRFILIGKTQGLKKYVDKETLKLEEKDGAIAFIPPCTEKVFQKTYNPLPNGLREWERNDAKAYLKNIAITLKKFLYANDSELQTALTTIDSLKKELNNTEK
jgi:hypothetical protein